VVRDQPDPHEQETPMLTRLAHVTVRHRWLVIGVWLLLTLFGAFAAGQVSGRWFQSSSVPGQPAYEASQRSVQALDVGARPPSVVVLHTSGDATKSTAIEQAMQRAATAVPGARLLIASRPYSGSIRIAVA